MRKIKIFSIFAHNKNDRSNINLIGMSLKKIIYLLIICTSILNVSCGDDEKKDLLLNQDDPRVRSVVFMNISSPQFVINDTEALIYNYDSLTYGIDLSKVKVYFYGYTSSPTFYYRYDAVSAWMPFKNGSAIDISKPFYLFSTSEDGTQTKTYLFEARVHKYDVNAFTWKKIGDINLTSPVVSQKSIVYNNQYQWFCRTSAGENYQFVSTKENDWTMKKLDKKKYQWETLALFSDTLWIQDEEGVIYTSPTTKLNFKQRSLSVKVDRLLFELDNKLWAIADNKLYTLYKDSTDFCVKNELPSDFSVENITTFTANSGFTQLGYIYATQKEKGTIWTLDYSGNLLQLVSSGTTIPYLTNPMVYIYDKTLGIVGGKLKDGTYSSECYASYDSGKTWGIDWHKKLNSDIEGINNAGVFAYSSLGELVIVGGNIKEEPSPTVWKGVLNKLIADELNYK